MYLFFDTETTGLPLNWKAPLSDTKNWPRIVSLGWIAANSERDIGEPVYHLIKPNGFTIPRDAVLTHGITTDMALSQGVDLLPVLQQFQAALQTAKCVIAHNVDFDRAVVGAEFLRAGLADPLVGKRQHCTMKESTSYCRIPGGFSGNFKWPTLQQLYVTLFQTKFDGAHDAAADCRACLQCYFRLQELGVMA